MNLAYLALRQKKDAHVWEGKVLGGARVLAFRPYGACYKFWVVSPRHGRQMTLGKVKIISCASLILEIWRYHEV